MSLYKAHKPICEIRTSIHDWYFNVLWVSIDKRGDKPVIGYKWNAKNKCPYRKATWRENMSVNARIVDMPTACEDATLMRFKLTNRANKCKIFMRYRRPYVALQDETLTIYVK